MNATQSTTARLAWRQSALVAGGSALPLSMLGPALMIISQG